MRLLFEWIKCDENKVFNNCGINFTDDYIISYDSDSHILRINKSDSRIPRNFYTMGGSNVVKQVTCILGKNGSGKTSLLKHIFKTDLISMEDDTKQNYPFWNTIQVIEYNSKLNIYHNQKEIAVESVEPYAIWDVTNRKTVNETLEDGCYAHLTKIFVSNDYTVALNSNFTNKGLQSHLAFTPYDIRVLQSGFFELITKQSNSILVWRNLFYKFNKYLQNNSNQQFFQNILYFLFFQTLVKSNKRDKFNYFHDVKITFQSIGKSDAYIELYALYDLITRQFTLEKIINNTVGIEEIEDFAKQQNIELDIDRLKICAIHGLIIKKLGVDCDSIYSNLRVNLITEILLSLSDFEANLCELKSYDDIEGLLQILEKRIENLKEVEEFGIDTKTIKQNELEYFKTANKSIEKLKYIIPKIESEEIVLLDENLSLVDYLYEEIRSKQSFVIKYFWLSYMCSAGERAFLNICSDLNSFLDFKYLSNYAINGINKNVLLILDEPDLYCHPEWQRKMLHEIIESLELLYQGYSFHIIFSTHSPLFLSDVPRENTVMLDKKENGVCVVERKDKQTFGANIFDLYNDSFLLDSFIGEFAQQKISAIIRKISVWYSQDIKVPKNDLRETAAIIDLIGEPILKNKLNNMLRQIQERGHY